jgi:hypothetical protein
MLKHAETYSSYLIILIHFGFQEILEQLDAFARRVDEQPRPENLSHPFPQALLINVHSCLESNLHASLQDPCKVLAECLKIACLLHTSTETLWCRFT